MLCIGVYAVVLCIGVYAVVLCIGVYAVVLCVGVYAVVLCIGVYAVVLCIGVYAVVLCIGVYAVVLCVGVYAVVLCIGVYAVVLCIGVYAVVLCIGVYAVVLCIGVYAVVLCVGVNAAALLCIGMHAVNTAVCIMRRRYMKSELCVFLAVFLSQLQLGLSQGDNLTLPLTQTIQVIKGDNNVCPPDDIQQVVQDKTDKEIALGLRKIASIVEPCDGKGYGEVRHCPAKSCNDIIERNPVYPLSGYYWLNISDETTVRVYCDMTKGVCADSTLLGLYDYCPVPSCLDIVQSYPDPETLLDFYWIKFQNGTITQLNCKMMCFPTVEGYYEVCPAASCSEIVQSNPEAPSDYYWIELSNGTVSQLYCDMSARCPCSSASGYTRIAYVNMTDDNHTCPNDFKTITTPRRVCGRQTTTSAGCNSATFSVLGMQYQHVCGRITGWQIGHPNAFYGGTGQGQGIDGHYIDGISVTYGKLPRQHVWSLACTRRETDTDTRYICPCSNTAVSGVTVPSFVGSDYFCETGITGSYSSGLFYTNSDPLWDGKGCVSSTTTCCTHNNPPWFCKQLPAPTTENIEVRVCDQNGVQYDDSPFELIEIYII